MIKASETTGILLDNKFCVQKKNQGFFFLRLWKRHITRKLLWTGIRQMGILQDIVVVIPKNVCQERDTSEYWK